MSETKLILFLILISFSISNSFSQQNEFIAAIFFNANGIEIKGDNEIFWQSSRGKIWGGGGLSCGANVKRYITKNNYINLELRYIQKGSVYEYLNLFGTINLDMIRLNYLEVPILCGHKFYINEREYFIETGLGYARHFSSISEISEFGSRNYSPDAKYFKNHDLSWLSSFKFPLNRQGKQNLLFGLRFSYSLLSIHNNYNLRNLVYGIQFDYVFNK